MVICVAMRCQMVPPCPTPFGSRSVKMETLHTVVDLDLKDQKLLDVFLTCALSTKPHNQTVRYDSLARNNGFVDDRFDITSSA